MFGHGTFIYDPRESRAKHGSYEAAARALADMDMSHAWLRVHDKRGLWRTADNQAFLQALKAQGITVFGWGWCDGNNVSRDVANVREALDTHDLDGYVADIEDGESGASWTTGRIRDFCTQVRPMLSGRPFLVSTFGFIAWHKPQLIQAAEPYVDAFAPQVYWFWYPRANMLTVPGATGQYTLNNAASYTDICIDTWKHQVSKPLVLTGQAYWGEASGWSEAHAERKIGEFIDGFDRYDEIAGLNWWHFAGKRAMSEGMTRALTNAQLGHKFSGTAPQPRSSTESNSHRRTPDAYVRADKLNLRAEPSDDPDTIITALSIGTPVSVIGPSGTPGWKEIAVDTGTRLREGHVFDKFLRAPENDAIERLLAETHDEWFRFQRGRGPENVDPYSGYVGEMWTELGFPDRDGTSPYAWSAAFISWVVKNAGYTNFHFSALHSKYIHQAIKRREMQIDGPFWGFQLEEHKPKIGDIVCLYRDNEDAQGIPIIVDYEYAEENSTFFSHTDIVVQVNDRSVRAIGGNTGQSTFGHRGSVSMKSYRLDTGGALIEENRLFAVMRNNLR